MTLEPTGAAGPVGAAAASGPRLSSSAFVFTGSGSEYFRIWVVNLLLTVLTLGVYSAWAKVRRAKYFWQNTRLDGHVFDYHGRPVAILRGRIIALVLLAAYSWAFQFSTLAGLVTVVVLCAVGPWLFMWAQQFKLGNTSYRGLRFGFRAHPAEAYRAVLLVLALWLLPAVVIALDPYDRWPFLVSSVLATGFVPWMHHRLKAYQHGRATYGDWNFVFWPVTGKFYGVYAKGLFFVLLGAVLSFFVLTFALYVSGYSARMLVEWDGARLLLGAVAALLTYVIAWPYLAARLQQVVWTTTHLQAVSFRTEIRAGDLFFLVFVNVMLTLVTCGLYWPFAAVTLARYRIGCMRVDSFGPLDAVAVGLHASPVTAAGDSALDSFGLDLGI